MGENSKYIFSDSERIIIIYVLELIDGTFQEKYRPCFEKYFLDKEKQTIFNVAYDIGFSERTMARKLRIIKKIIKYIKNTITSFTESLSKWA